MALKAEGSEPDKSKALPLKEFLELAQTGKFDQESSLYAHKIIEGIAAHPDLQTGGVLFDKASAEDAYDIVSISDNPEVQNIRLVNLMRKLKEQGELDIDLENTVAYKKQVIYRAAGDNGMRLKEVAELFPATMTVSEAVDLLNDPSSVYAQALNSVSQTLPFCPDAKTLAGMLAENAQLKEIGPGTLLEEAFGRIFRKDRFVVASAEEAETGQLAKPSAHGKAIIPSIDKPGNSVV